MLNERELEEAVEIGDRAYRLLTWLNRAVESGFIAKHFHDVPENARPLGQVGPPLRRFANYFSTYLRSSFDLHEVPGTRFDLGREPYCCELCGYRVPMAHLRPKKLGTRDREKARLLKNAFLERLAGEAAIGVQPERIEQLLRDPDASRRAALAAYGDELLRRLEGQASGPAAPALWREFAWSPKGSPIKGFKLAARKIKEAEEQVLADLRNNAA